MTQPGSVREEWSKDSPKVKGSSVFTKSRGDTFRSCFGKPGAERPTDFTSKAGDGRTLSVWKRAKQPAPETPPK
jgi:hypothetical protein